MTTVVTRAVWALDRLSWRLQVAALHSGHDHKIKTIALCGASVAVVRLADGLYGLVTRARQ